MKNELEKRREKLPYTQERERRQIQFFVAGYKVNKKHCVMHLSWPVELVGALLGSEVTHTNTRY